MGLGEACLAGGMAWDPVEVFGASVWRFMPRMGIFLSALMLGGLVGEMAREFRHGFPDIEDFVDPFLEAPQWIYLWIFTSAAPLVIGLMCVFLISSWSPYWWWVATVALVSAAATGQSSRAGWGWLVWLILVVMVAAAVWYWKAWQQNRWARELMAIEVENQVSRIQAEEDLRAEVERLQREE
jgi:hypothetical protein